MQSVMTEHVTDEVLITSTPATQLSASAPTSPTSDSPKLSLSHSLSDRAGRKAHRVNFPDDIVSGYFDAPDPWGYEDPTTIDSLADSYRNICKKQSILPIESILKQLETYSNNEFRKHDLLLKGEKLDSLHCEAIEEILKRIQFRLIDLDSCELDCEGASALFEMIDYYESASHLNICNNKSIGVLGWQALCRMLKKTTCLQYMSLSNTALNEQILLILGRSMRLGSHLVTLNLTNVGLYGRRLAILVAALKLNTTLKELYLSENKITSADGVQLGNLLRSNYSMDLLDLSRNYLQDIGLEHICDGLGLQNQSSNNEGGLQVLNISDNQITNRGMNHLSETLSVCQFLKVLNLAMNPLGNEGITLLKTGLISNRSIRYLNIGSTLISCEGVISIAEYIADSNLITKIDLTGNQIEMSGLMALSLALKHNTSINEIRVSNELQSNQSFEQVVNEITSQCLRNKNCNMIEENDLYFLKGFELTNECNAQTFNDDENSAPNIPLEDIHLYSPHIISSCSSEDDNHQSNNRDQSPVIVSVKETTSLSQHKPVGSSSGWNNNNEQGNDSSKRSGRFSVSPVSMGGSNLQSNIKVEISEVEFDNDMKKKELDEEEKLEIGVESSDQLADLPTVIPNKNVSLLSSFLLPETRNLSNRRMSTPILSTTSPHRPNAFPKVKICTNLESLDLKSSVPISPTFYAKTFEFPDPIALRLPSEVEEVIALLPNFDDDINTLTFW